MNKVDELRDLLSANVAKVTELLNRKDKDKETGKKKCPAKMIFAVIGITAVTAAAIYGLYRFFAPDYEKDFEDDLEDDLEDDFFDEEDEDDGEADEQ